MNINNSTNNNKQNDVYHASKLGGFPINKNEYVKPKEQNKDYKQLLPNIKPNQQINKKIELQQNNNLQKCLKIKQIKVITDTAKKLLNDRNELIKKLYYLEEILYYDENNQILVYLNNENKISVSYHGKDIDETNIFIKSDVLLQQDWKREYDKIYNALQLSLSNYKQTLQKLIKNTNSLEQQYNHLHDKDMIVPILKEKIGKFKIIEEQIRKKQEEVEQQYQKAERKFKEFGQKVNKKQSSINNSIKANKEIPSHINQNNNYNFNCYKPNYGVENKNYNYNKVFNQKPFQLHNIKFPTINKNNYGNNLNQQHQMNKANNNNANKGNNNNIQNKFNNNHLYPPINNIGFLPKAYDKKLTNNNNNLKSEQGAINLFLNSKQNNGFKYDQNNYLKYNQNVYDNKKSSELLKINNHNIKIKKINIISTNNNPFNNNINNNNNQNKCNNYKIIPAECKQEQNNGNNINNNIKLPNIKPNINSKQNDNVKENNKIKLLPTNKNVADNNEKNKLKNIKPTKKQKIFKGQKKILENIEEQLKQIWKNNNLSDSKKQVIEEAKKTIDNTKQHVEIKEKELEQEFNELKNKQDPINKENINDNETIREILDSLK